MDRPRCLHNDLPADEEDLADERIRNVRVDLFDDDPRNETQENGAEWGKDEPYDSGPLMVIHARLA